MEKPKILTHQKIFREIISLVKTLFSRIFVKNSTVRVNFWFFHSVRNSLTEFFSSNQLFSNIFRKTLISRNFCQKCVKVNSVISTLLWHCKPTVVGIGIHYYSDLLTKHLCINVFTIFRENLSCTHYRFRNFFRNDHNDNFQYRVNS